LAARLGQAFVIENRQVQWQYRTEAVVRASADGYTLLMVSVANAINATLYDKLNFVFCATSTPVASIDARRSSCS